jgi:hypothetical protein
MTAHTMNLSDKQNIWEKLRAPVGNAAVSWRQDGKVHAKDGKYFARFVVYIEANIVRDRLDSIVPGEWDLTLELLPPMPAYEGGEGTECSFKARLQILGVTRENVGQGKDYKSAATDAFKRAAVGFGIGSELYDYEQNWVEMDGDGKYAKPVEDPQTAYARRYGSGAKRVDVAANAAASPNNGAGQPTPASLPASTLTDMEAISCPKCGGRMWDNRLTKRNPRGPDYKCQNRSCDGVIWPPKETKSTATPQPFIPDPTYP